MRRVLGIGRGGARGLGERGRGGREGLGGREGERDRDRGGENGVPPHTTSDFNH